MKTIHFAFSPSFDVKAFFYYCYYFGIPFSFNGYESVTISINEDFEKEVRERIRTNNFEF